MGTATDAFGRIFGLIGVLSGGYIFDFVGGFWFCIITGVALLGAALIFSTILLPTASRPQAV